jgi:uncharacterized protein with PIN domain
MFFMHISPLRPKRASRPEGVMAKRQPPKQTREGNIMVEIKQGAGNDTRRRCSRCGVRFADGPPPQKHAASQESVEWLRCPDCGVRFWVALDSGSDNESRCLVGLYTGDAA